MSKQETLNYYFAQILHWNGFTRVQHSIINHRKLILLPDRKGKFTNLVKIKFNQMTTRLP